MELKMGTYEDGGRNDNNQGKACLSFQNPNKDNLSQNVTPSNCDSGLPFHCQLCDLNFATDLALQIHYGGKIHQKNVNISQGFDTERSVESVEPIQKGPLYCEICDITCTGVVSLKMHLNGQKHAKKLRLKQEAEQVKRLEKELNEDDTRHRLPGQKRKRVVMIQLDVDKCDQPLVGLDYLTEFQKDDFSIEPLYICDLCEVKIDCRQFLFHVTGLKHRMAYFKYHSPADYQLLFNKMKKSEKAKLALHCAQVLEEVEGRHKVRLKVEKPSSVSSLLGGPAGDKEEQEMSIWEEIEIEGTRNVKDLPGLWKSSKQTPSDQLASPELRLPYSKRFRNPFDIFDRPPVHGSKVLSGSLPCNLSKIESSDDRGVNVPCEKNLEQEQIKKLLEEICYVENEEDAEVALQVSNALTKALLEYRMKSLEGSDSMQDTLDEVKKELKNLSRKAKSIPIPKKDNYGSSVSTNSDHVIENQPASTATSSSAFPAVKAAPASGMDLQTDRLDDGASLLRSSRVRSYGKAQDVERDSRAASSPGGCVYVRSSRSSFLGHDYSSSECQMLDEEIPYISARASVRASGFSSDADVPSTQRSLEPWRSRYSSHQMGSASAECQGHGECKRDDGTGSGVASGSAATRSLATCRPSDHSHRLWTAASEQNPKDQKRCMTSGHLIRDAGAGVGSRQPAPVASEAVECRSYPDQPGSRYGQSTAPRRGPSSSRGQHADRPPGGQSAYGQADRTRYGQPDYGHPPTAVTQYSAYLASPAYKAYLVQYHAYRLAKDKQLSEPTAPLPTDGAGGSLRQPPAPPPLPKEPPPAPPPPPPPPTSPEPKRHRPL